MSLLKPVTPAQHGQHYMAEMCTDAGCEPCRPLKERRREWTQARNELWREASHERKADVNEAARRRAAQRDS